MPAPTRCWCSSSTPRSPRWTPRTSSPTCWPASIGAAGVVTGDDFTFGKGRTGDVALLKTLGAQHGIIAEAVPQVAARRRARLLGPHPRGAGRRRHRARPRTCSAAPYAIEGVVQHGDKRGRELGYPTANLALGDYQRPRYGIYAVRVTLDDGSEHPGVASLGVRPTFDPPEELLEALSVRLRRRPLRPQDRGRAARLSSATRRSSTASTPLDRADARGRSRGAAAARSAAVGDRDAFALSDAGSDPLEPRAEWPTLPTRRREPQARLPLDRLPAARPTFR